MQPRTAKESLLSLIPEFPLVRGVRAYVPFGRSTLGGGVIVSRDAKELAAIEPHIQGLTKHTDESDKKHLATGVLIQDQQAWRDTLATLEAGRFRKDNAKKSDYPFYDRITKG